MNAAAGHLEGLRAAGAAAFQANGLPDRRVESWRYTPLRGLEAGVEGRDTVAPEFLLAGDTDGLEIQALPAALEADRPGLADLLASLGTGHPAQSFSALNNAALNQGLYVRVAAGVDAGRLEWLWRAVAGAWVHSRVCLVLEPDSRLEVFERFGPELQTSLNVVTQVQLQEGARLVHARLQAGHVAPALVTRIEITQAARSAFEYTGLDLDGQLVRHDLRAQLQGSDAACMMNGAYLPRGTSHVDNHLDVEHRAPGCVSHQFFRGVLDDRARAVFNGRVHVHRGADGTEARQANANLLLSRYAEVDTKPELEIEADEVVASHGATVGQLDEEAVFYLRSRGLDEDQARQLLTAAFCRAVLDRMGAGPSREALSAALSGALGTAP